MVSYILFDLDNTLYPESSGFQGEIGRLMTAFVSEYLGVSLEEAADLRKTGFKNYGTTLKWLTAEHDLKDRDDFLEKTHPKDPQRFLERNTETAETLGSILQPKAVITNAHREHAERVLEFLGIRRFFEHVFDIRFQNFVGKPDKSAYVRVLEAIGRKPHEVLFIDDVPEYLLPFREMGGQILCMNEKGPCTGTGFPVIRALADLPDFLRNTFEEIR